MIKRADKEDAAVLASLAIQMWTDNDPEGLTGSFRELLGHADAACFLKYLAENRSASRNASCGMITSRARKRPRSAIWKGYSFFRSTEAEAMALNCCPPASTGPGRRAVRNLPAIASFPTTTACASILPRASRKPTGSSVSEKGSETGACRNSTGLTEGKK